MSFNVYYLMYNAHVEIAPAVLPFRVGVVTVVYTEIGNSTEGIKSEGMTGKQENIVEMLTSVAARLS